MNEHRLPPDEATPPFRTDRSTPPPSPSVIGAARPDPAAAAVRAVDAWLRGADGLGDRVEEIGSRLPA